MMHRVYINMFEEDPLIWSVDTGPKSNVVHVHGFFISEGVASASGRANDVSKHAKQPKAWIEIYDAVAKLINGHIHFGRV